MSIRPVGGDILTWTFISNGQTYWLTSRISVFWWVKRSATVFVRGQTCRLPFLYRSNREPRSCIASDTWSDVLLIFPLTLPAASWSCHSLQRKCQRLIGVFVLTPIYIICCTSDVMVTAQVSLDIVIMVFCSLSEYSSQQTSCVSVRLAVW